MKPVNPVNECLLAVSNLPTIGKLFTMEMRKFFNRRESGGKEHVSLRRISKFCLDLDLTAGGNWLL
jgi:hypothetical protein